MDWPELIPTIGITLLLFFLPGGLPLAVLGLRPLPMISLAPAVAVAVVALSAIAASLLDHPWGPIPIVVGTAVAVVAALGLRVATARRRRRLPFTPERSSAARSVPSLLALVQYVVGIAIFLLVTATQWMQTLISPLTIAQQKDNAFHLNAVGHAIRERRAAPWDIGEMSGSPFYPPGFHDMTSAVILSAPWEVPLPAAFHAVMLVMVMVVWPLSMALLVETVLRPGPAARLLTGPLCFSFVAFPLILLDWGLLYPNILGFALVPVLIALVLELVRRRTAQVPGPWVVALLIVTVAGATLAHPNSAASAALLSVPVLVVGLVRAVRERPMPRWWIAFLAAAVVGIVVVWLTLAPSLSAAPWAPVQTPSQALGEVLTGTSAEKPAIWTGGVLLLVGLVSLVAGHRHLWLFGTWAVAAFVYVAVTSWDDGFWRDLVGGMLYRDQFRAGALLTYAWVPIAAAGVQALADRIGDRFRTRLPVRLRTRPAAVAAAVIAALVLSALTAGTAGFNKRLVEIRTTYEYSDASMILSADELEVFEDVRRLVPEDSTLVVDPWDGSSLAYAFTGRDVTSYYSAARPSPEVRYVVQHIDEVATDPKVCRLLDQMDAGHVLSFGDVELFGGDQAGTFEELENLSGTEGLERIAHHGDAYLYEITACD